VEYKLAAINDQSLARSKSDFNEEQTFHVRRIQAMKRMIGIVLVMLVTLGTGARAAMITGLGDLSGGSFYSVAFGVSADGAVVVGYSSGASGYEAFRWTSGGGMVGLGDLSGGSFSSLAYGVSADGSIIVGYSESGTGNGAFLWDSVNGMRSLYNVLTVDYGLDLTGWTLSSAWGISGNGRYVVGYGTHNGNTEAFLVDLYNAPAAVPEPGILSLLAVGGLMIFRYGSRRRSAW
jgi:probable HAF family extracellular repeat protein